MFWFAIPLGYGHAPQDAPSAVPEPTEAPQTPTVADDTRSYVLLAEDNMVNRKVAVRLLEKLGCRVDTAINGHAALEAYHQTHYDLIFMDCQMPEMDGYSATQAIRTHEATQGGYTPIIALTANAMQGDRERCLQAGMDDYLSKPISSERLADILEKWRDAAKRATTSAAPVEAASSAAPVSSITSV
jgi:CheY-like chemotaxis protein